MLPALSHHIDLPQLSMLTFIFIEQIYGFAEELQESEKQQNMKSVLCTNICSTMAY